MEKTKQYVSTTLSTLPNLMLYNIPVNSHLSIKRDAISKVWTYKEYHSQNDPVSVVF